MCVAKQQKLHLMYDDLAEIKRDPSKYEKQLAVAKDIGPIDNAEAVYNLVARALAEKDQECILVIGADVRWQLRGVVKTAMGQQSRVGVGLKEVVFAAIGMGAEYVFFVHNHPAGNASPSDADKELTQSLVNVFEPFGEDLIFVDHVIIGTNQFYSFEENELYDVQRR